MANGSDWIKAAYKCEMSEFGIRVADLLGKVFQGIYHLAGPALKRVDWSDNYRVELHLVESYASDLATYDFDLLTRLVVASHDQCIRISIAPHTFRCVKLLFHSRKRADGQLNISQRMPTLEDHAADIRERYLK